MKIAQDWTEYSIIATGDGYKLERWKDVCLLRPDPQVIWSAQTDLFAYPELNAYYKRSEKGGGGWKILKPMPEEWEISYQSLDLRFKIKPMGFKHTGLFPEQAANWSLMTDIIRKESRKISVLNLFGYTGGASVACAAAGAFVTHVDAAKGMVERCKLNAKLSNLPGDSIRYIVDDCAKFVAREIKRGKSYDAVIMDPPSYGRGPGGELWKIEDDIFGLLSEVKKVLSDSPVFFLVNSYTTGLQPTVIDNLLSITLGSLGGTHSAYEVGLPTSDKRGVVLPCGCSGLWVNSEGA